MSNRSSRRSNRSSRRSNVWRSNGSSRRSNVWRSNGNSRRRSNENNPSNGNNPRNPLFNRKSRDDCCIIDQNDSFRYFRLLMSTCNDSICKNIFETSHVWFIHENFSVLITSPLDHFQQNLLRKETCQTTAKPADIVLQT